MKTKIMSALVANRAQFYSLVNALEAEVHANVDDMALSTLIDCEFAGRTEVTAGEAASIIIRVASPAPTNDAAADTRQQ